MRKVFLAAVLGVGLSAVSAFAEDIVVKEAPPADLVDDRGAPPSKDHVWIDGYHKWDGHVFVWVPGHWEAPPHAKAKWEKTRWRKDHGQWVFMEGHWK